MMFSRIIILMGIYLTAVSAIASDLECSQVLQDEFGKFLDQQRALQDKDDVENGTAELIENLKKYLAKESISIHPNELAFEIIKHKLDQIEGQIRHPLEILLDNDVEVYKYKIDHHDVGHNLVKEAIRHDNHKALKILFERGFYILSWNGEIASDIDPNGRTSRALTSASSEVQAIVASQLKRQREILAQREADENEVLIRKVKQLIDEGKVEAQHNDLAHKMLVIGETELFKLLVLSGASIVKEGPGEIGFRATYRYDLVKSSIRLENDKALEFLFSQGAVIPFLSPTGKTMRVINNTTNLRLKQLIEKQLEDQNTADLAQTEVEKDKLILFVGEFLDKIKAEGLPSEIKSDWLNSITGNIFVPVYQTSSVTALANQLAYWMIKYERIDLLERIIQAVPGTHLSGHSFDYYDLVKQATKDKNIDALRVLIDAGARI